MQYAWIEYKDGVETIRDLNADPKNNFHQDVATYYSVEIDDSVEVGAQLINGVWVNPTIEPVKPPKSRILTKLEFRKLFTSPEMIAIDNYASNDNITVENKQALQTISKNFDAATSIDLDDQLTIEGVKFFEQVGLLKAGRAAEILA